MPLACRFTERLAPCPIRRLQSSIAPSQGCSEVDWSPRSQRLREPAGQRPTLQGRWLACRRERGLTLLEMMVAVALLLMIVTGLTMMFIQTQRAFKGGLGQVDVFESGRAAMEMITRDLEQMAPSGDTANTNFILSLAYPANTLTNLSVIANSTDTNICRNFFVLSHAASWQGTSYKVIFTNSSSFLVGTLYRHTTANINRIHGNFLSTDFMSDSLTYSNRVIDGVARFQVRVYSSSGKEIIADQSDPRFDSSIFNSNFTNSPSLLVLYFSNNELPGYLEVELGILEPQVVELLPVFQTEQKRKEFVELNSSKIHIFRQQIPIRAVSR